MAGIFKAYDIRGIYGKTIDNNIVYKIGRAFATLLKCKKVVVGRDMRFHSNPLFTSLSKGLIKQGVDVIDLGLVSTPMSYYANGKLGADAGIMITASHNSGEWNGLKLTREQAIPISGATGIQDLERIVKNKAFDPPSKKIGTISKHDIIASYKQHIEKRSDLVSQIKIVADMANSMGSYEAKTLKDIINIDPIFETLDGSFPNHEANPLKTETMTALQDKVRSGKYNFGVAFDGDADRVGFVDEKGNIIPMDIISALIAQDILKKGKGTILYDLRSSWAVKEIIESSGGTPEMCRVGHAFIKQQMRDSNAIYAGELSGHYYFRDNYFTESSAMAVLSVANIVSKSGKTLSDLISPIQHYYASGEINSEVSDTESVLTKLKEIYSDGTLTTLDGISIEYDNWWFNVRCSNTEPLIRLNLEAKTREMMEAKRDNILTVIRG